MDAALTARIDALLQKEHLSLLITDSGLGGLAVCAAIAARLKSQALTPRVSMTYFNAWPHPEYGYNRLAGDSERIQAFDRALAGMARLRPDLILIACNTLSVLYPRSAFSRCSPIPVVDIVDFGVNLILSALRAAPDHPVLILGTRTTIGARTHAMRLEARGVDPRRIRVQPCDQLATQIEKGPASPATLRLVDRFMGQAAAQADDWPGGLFAALCCTHYGYCGDRIKASLEAHLPGRQVTLLNPNDALARFLFDRPGAHSGRTTALDLRVVSKIRWEPERIEAMAAALGPVSAQTVGALQAYEQIPDLFPG